jgi:ribosome-associated toxin RatA of RatAB toxin-antitoxin module
MTRISSHRTVDAPVEVVWDVVTDHELYAEAAPNLSTVEVVEGDRDGMVRRCVDADGNEWTETCTRWDERSGFAVAVDVADSDFHRRLFRRFEGEWTITETADGVRITVAFDFDPKYGPLGVLVSKYLAYRAPGIVESIFDRWEAEIRSRTGDGRRSAAGDRSATTTPRDPGGRTREGETP